jgi:CMP-N,N'-diacetyllegionaminic acid synthase
MIGGGRVLGLIPARGGSKGVPRKNVRPLAGKPLLQWTAEAARASRYIDRLVLSTDDDEIATLGLSLGLEVPFRRPAEASSDEASAREVIQDALARLEERFEYLVYLQPTSPLRTTADIDGCLEALAATDTDACVSVTRSAEKVEWLFFVGPDARLTPVLGTPPPLRRQELRSAFVLNGAVYAARLDAYKRAGTFLTDRTSAWVMPPDRSMDLDEMADFDRAEVMLQRGAGPAG